jgi:hypothetical protein
MNDEKEHAAKRFIRDFVTEVALVGRNKDLQRLLNRRSQEKAALSLAEVRRRLRLA